MQAHLTDLETRIATINSNFKDQHTQTLYSTVGRALTTWSRMEELIVVIVACLLRVKISKAGLVMYSVINFTAWLTITTDLFAADEKLKPYQGKWNKIAERLRKIKDKRDQLAHHSVDPGEQVTALAQLKSPRFDYRRKSLGQKPMTIEEIVSFTETILEISESLAELAEIIVDVVQQVPQEEPPAQAPGPTQSSDAQ